MNDKNDKKVKGDPWWSLHAGNVEGVPYEGPKGPYATALDGLLGHHAVRLWFQEQAQARGPEFMDAIEGILVRLGRAAKELDASVGKKS
jgi:hypothetical protein